MQPPELDPPPGTRSTRATTTPLGILGLVIALGVVFALGGALLWGGFGVGGPGSDGGVDPSVGDDQVSDSSPPHSLENEAPENESAAEPSGTSAQPDTVPDLSTRLDTMESTLIDEHGIEITATYDDEREVLEVEHATETRSQDAYADEAYVITAAYAELIREGYDIDRMVVSVTPTPNGPTIGSWHVDQAWVEAYIAGELTADELIDRIQETGSLG